ncbi:sugar transferase [Carnobacterium gallinarum]|uniref:sugar transferase n=1 Tax=Carnobacterium gallinarum TaxID=2749 RepID=UPI00054F8CA4|nr:sugar transferase [Carnobacterium gallinarum]
MYNNFFKRFLDFIVAFILLFLLSPIIFLTYLLIKILLKGPALFKQQRPGKDHKIFTIYKFRTMTDKKNSLGELLPDSERLTGLGKFIRKTSLDELPQLYNVFRGEMSFIGPRPLLIEYLPLYSERQKKRHYIRPGITGWAQVNGRNAISWEQKFEYDIYYIQHLSLLLDMKIIFLTIKKVIISEDINQQGQATVERFKG